ncbi:hypothetical protein BLA14095_05850 [Burkholderia lata]|nr:hypothetical protein BLA14095_05850 [Burkholderia lata]
MLAMSTSILLITSLAINVLDISHGLSGYSGIDRLALGIVEDWASVVPRTSLSDPTVSRQTLAFVIAFVLSCLFFGLVAFLGVLRRSATASRYQQLVFSSFIISLGLIRYSVVALPTTALLWIARWRGFDPSSHSKTGLGVLALTYVAVFVWSQLSERSPQRRMSPGSRDDDAPLAYSAFVPVLIGIAVFCSAIWTNDHLDPGIMLQTSDACGAPDNGACTLYIRPRNGNGAIFLDKIDVSLLVMFDEAPDFVGPRYVTGTRASFRMIEAPDTPLPVQVGTKTTRGVVGHNEFKCPEAKNLPKGKAPQIRIIWYSASAFPRVLSEAEPERRVSIRVTFERLSDVLLLFRNGTKGCTLVP